MSLFGRVFGGSSEIQTGIPELFPFPISPKDYIRISMIAIYSKILNDTCERTEGLSDEEKILLSDSCVQNASSRGLVTLLAEAMADMSEVGIVYKNGVVRIADDSEMTQIQKDYKEKAESDVGVLVSFNKYRRSQMLAVFIAMENSAMASLYKTMNVAKTTQIKINDLRKGVGLPDSQIAIDQAKGLGDALRKGQDILIDKLDEIANAAPDVTAAKEAISFLNSRIGFILGFPEAYITSILSGGLGSTGEADAREIERGLKQYFTSIILPICDQLFDVTVTFKTEDFRAIAANLEIVKTMEVTSDTLISAKDKKDIVDRAMGIKEE